MKLTKEQQGVVKYIVNVATADGELVDQFFVVEKEDETIHFDNEFAYSVEFPHFGKEMGIDIEGRIRRDIKRRKV